MRMLWRHSFTLSCENGFDSKGQRITASPNTGGSMTALLPFGMRKNSFLTIGISLLAACVLAACNPKYNWRDYSSPNASYRVMFPSKPATHTRAVDLNGMKVDMTMTAAEVDGTMFAVGSAQAPDAASAQAALDAMKTALVRNIGATITKEKSASATAIDGDKASQRTAIDIEATGARNGIPIRLIGHFEARNTRLYQVVVMGKDKDIAPEQTEQFMSSFKLL